MSTIRSRTNAFHLLLIECGNSLDEMKKIHEVCGGHTGHTIHAMMQEGGRGAGRKETNPEPSQRQTERTYITFRANRTSPAKANYTVGLPLGRCVLYCFYSEVPVR